MIGLGTIINTAAIVLAGVTGHFAGRLLQGRDEQQDSMTKACGISVMFISIAGVMEGMLKIADGSLESGRAMFTVLCVALGTLIGELLGIEKLLDRFGEWLKRISGNSGDATFVEAFVSATMTVCIGAMAIVGSIQDGVFGDYSTLAVKSVLDFIIIIVLTTSMGKGAAFSAIPIFLLQGGVTLLAKLIAPVLTEAALENLSLVGSVLIFCVGINLVWGKKIRVANMLPAIILAVGAAYLPFEI